MAWGALPQQPVTLFIDKTNKNHIIETPETIEVNIVNPGNKQIKVNLPGQAEFK